jgi:hypothetical protein
LGSSLWVLVSKLTIGVSPIVKQPFLCTCYQVRVAAPYNSCLPNEPLGSR